MHVVSRWFVTSVKLSALLVVAFLGHQYLILPLESQLSSSGLVAVASLVFIPHGVKALIVTVTGYYSILPVLIAQFIGGIFYDLDVRDALSSAFIGAIAVTTPLLLLRTIKQNIDSHRSFNLFWVMVYIGIVSSLLNALLISIYRGYDLSGAISTRFLLGDLLGVVVVFLLVVLFRKSLIRFSISQIRKALKDN